MKARTALFAAIAATIALVTPSANAQCAADIDGDTNVNVTDLLDLLAAWGACGDPMNCPQDIAGDDDVIDVTDLLALLAGWGPCPVEPMGHLRIDVAGATATCWDEVMASCTNGHVTTPNESNAAGSSWGVAGLRLHLDAQTQIAEFNVVGGQALPFWSDPGHKVRINVHSTAQAFADDALTGDVMSIELDNAVADTLIDDPPMIVAGSMSTLGYNHFYLRFDFMPFTLDAGDYIISFVPLSNRNFNYAETATDLGSDIWTGSAGVGDFIDLDTALGATTGTMAADVKGTPVP